jgi:type I restriction enzyme S subunit
MTNLSKSESKDMMANGWPRVPLGEILIQSGELTDIHPDQQYRQVTVRLWGQGVMLRAEVSGANMASKQMYVVHPQQFLLSRIDARNGAFGLVPEFLDGAVVSNDFPSFNLNLEKITPRFLGWMSKTKWFVELCRAASEGTTNRVRLKIDRFLATEIPLPPLTEQRRIVARIEELAAKIEEARGLRQKAVEEAEVLMRTASSDWFNRVRAKDCPIGGTFKFRNDLIRPGDGSSGALRFIGLQHIESHSEKESVKTP